MIYKKHNRHENNSYTKKHYIIQKLYSKPPGEPGGGSGGGGGGSGGGCGGGSSGGGGTLTMNLGLLHNGEQGES